MSYSGSLIVIVTAVILQGNMLYLESKPTLEGNNNQLEIIYVRASALNDVFIKEVIVIF